MNFILISLLFAQAGQTTAPGALTTATVEMAKSTMIYALAPPCGEPPRKVTKPAKQGQLEFQIITCPSYGPLMATVANGKVALEPGYTYEEVIIYILAYTNKLSTEQHNRHQKELNKALSIADLAIKNGKECSYNFEQFRILMEKSLKGIQASMGGLKGNGK